MNAAGVDRITARRADVETQSVARIYEDHVQREEVADNRRHGTGHLVQSGIVKESRPAFVGGPQITIAVEHRCGPGRGYQLAYGPRHRVGGEKRIAGGHGLG